MWDQREADHRTARAAIGCRSIGGSHLGSEEFCTRLLEERGVCAVPGIGYGDSCDEFIRISVGSESMERIRRGVEQIAELVRETAAEPDAAPGERSGAAPRAMEPVPAA